MVKKKAAVVEKKSRGPWMAILAATMFLLSLLSVFVLIAAQSLPELNGIDKVLKGLGGVGRFALPFLFAWVGAVFVRGARGHSISILRVILHGLLVLLLYSAMHMFVAKYIDRNGYHVAQSLGYGDFLKKSYDFKIGGGAAGALIGGALYRSLGAVGGFFASILLATGCLAATGTLQIWIRKGRARAQMLREERQAEQRQRHEREADRNFDLDRRTMLKPEELVQPRTHTRPHAGTNPLAAAASGLVAPKAPRAPRAPRPAAEKAVAPAKPKRVATKPRIYNEVVEEKKEMPAESFGPVVRANAAPAPRPASEPFKPPVKGRVSKADLRIEPDEYELPDADAAPFDVPPARKGSKAPLKFKKIEEVSEEELYNYPPIDLLAHGQAPDKGESDQSDIEKAQLLGDTLKSFGIETRLTGIAHGPAVTRFELQPAPGVKVSRITALADDLALNLAAERVRIEAPIPGKAAVGVEVPNDKIETVYLRDVLESADARRHASRVAAGLGKDNSGRYIVADIAKMPHVLIAGQTGSGKSVCINSIIVSILYRATPDEVKLILIDPKVVELSVYNNIPHLIAPVVTDPKKAASALDWAVAEMGTRYKRFADRGVRDIKGYNKKLGDGEKIMPQIVIVIDELADLMMVAPGEVEDSICRLAQLARAAGMHLVIATQRPSVNVITGIIKANIPTRIAFSVASQVDSRTMIDHGGAEKLLGNGDMLFVPSGINKPMRVQGAWVSDQEVHAVTEYIKERHGNTYDEDVVEKINHSVMSDAEKEDANDEYDPRLPEAVEIVIEAGQASISMLQRRMRVGYARAGRLIDEMAQRGIVSEADGAKPRSVLINREQFGQMFEEEEA